MNSKDAAANGAVDDVRITITLAGSDMVGGDTAGASNSYQLSDQFRISES